ncbi:DinB family protein [Catenulispora yoronensis]|uniref:DinB family protein n=1 Tax=Catenulispora yoronensis TaxID=450799 RepID=A0ABP5F1F5_9ACTN
MSDDTKDSTDPNDPNNSVKAHLLASLRFHREVLIWKLDGLSEYDIRRPLTVTGTNLLGLVKHAATWEARYFGEVFGRPFPEPIQPWQEADGSDLWVRADETRDEIIAFYGRAAQHADATIETLSADTPGHVPWWPEPETTLINILIHMLLDINRHAGHADILREGLDGRTGGAAKYEEPINAAAREAHFATVEAAAQQVLDH